MKLQKIKQKMRKFKDSAGFDLAADIDSIKSIEDAKKILDNHKNWLDDLANDAQRSVDDFEKELTEITEKKGDE